MLAQFFPSNKAFFLLVPSRAVQGPAISGYKGNAPLKDILMRRSVPLVFTLREIPTDPLTGKTDWVPHFDTVVLDKGRTTFGIDDVHSRSEHNGLVRRRKADVR